MIPDPVRRAFLFAIAAVGFAKGADATQAHGSKSARLPADAPPADLAAARGSSRLGYLPGGASPLTRTVQDKLRESVSTADKSGAFLAQLQAVGSDFAAGGKALIPAGTNTLSAKFTFAGQRLNLEGDGPNVSFISFSPASADVAIEFDSGAGVGASGQFQSSIRGLGFTSNNSVDKTAILLTNSANPNVERVGIPEGAWLGSGSIGIQAKGRQFLRFRDNDIACARPIVFSPNTAFPSLGGDYAEVASCELITTIAAGICLEVESGAILSNFAVRNTALCKGKYGFRYVDTAGVIQAIANLEFRNIRTEQGTDATGWSFDIGSTNNPIQSVLFENIFCEHTRNGIRLRNCQRITLINVSINQVGGKVALDIVFVPGTVLTIIGGWNQTGGMVRLANAKKVVGIGSSTGGGFGPFEIWVYDTGNPLDNAVELVGLRQN